MKKFIRKHFGSFVYFYSYLRYKIFISIGLSLVVGTLDGFGLAMFLPLMQMVDGNKGDINPEQMGNMGFLVNGIKAIGLNLNLTTVLLIMLAFFVLKGIARFIEGYYRLILQLSFIKQIRFSNVNLLSGFKYSTFVTSDSGRIQNTFSGEVERVLKAYQSYFAAFQYGVLVFVYIFMAFTVNPQFSLLVLVGGGLANFVFKRFYRFTKDSSKKLTRELHGFQGLLMQIIGNFKYLKSTGLIYSFAENLKNSINKTQEIQKKIGLLTNWLTMIREPLVMLVIVSVILVQVNVFQQPLGLIVLSLFFFYRSLSFLMSVQTYWNNFLTVSGSLENMTEFIDELSKNQVVYGKSPYRSFTEKLELREMSFAYGKENTLKNISFEIKKNQTVALVGESGSGKTTTMNILVGLLEIEKNMFFIDGKDINDFDVRTFQSKIGYITQDPVIFNDNLYNNITFWSEPTAENLAKFEEAMKRASIYDFVMNLPDKEKAMLGDNGVMISGGQKQRISIARELFKDIEILVMDEATSALDSETEKIIQDNLNSLFGSLTIIISAHRLSTIKNADKIIFLEKGEILDVGTFEELKTKSERFKRIVDLQTY
ncbi:ABC transporter ATP-binding protein [Pedobacter metabolipauper]|uniref:ABC-type multidrug transport system fused ATPase/permease subunit n=1 Tax=Pedobacter metabolipauper TaxID=425513 RepID=A0A4R6SWV6_9SPHI|nr:ABC transporter ATP-binding protein [Pedobacter metabolipauper]TDQ09921.1 ABC-type multidrug transport system fused ATPase/permease subunit [Pedobacter metabolipauper]